MVSLIRLVLVANSIKVSANLLKLTPPQSTSQGYDEQIWGRGLGLVTHTGSLALRARACTRLRRDMQMCSVAAIANKAGVFALFGTDFRSAS